MRSLDVACILPQVGLVMYVNINLYLPLFPPLHRVFSSVSPKSRCKPTFYAYGTKMIKKETDYEISEKLNSHFKSFWISNLSYHAQSPSSRHLFLLLCSVYVSPIFPLTPFIIYIHPSFNLRPIPSSYTNFQLPSSSSLSRYS